MDKLKYISYVLKENNVGFLLARFSGSGNDGSVDLHFFRSEASIKFSMGFKSLETVYMDELEEEHLFFLEEPTPYDSTLKEIIWDCVYNYLENKNIDYCNGRGNEGSIVFDFEEESIQFNFLEIIEKTLEEKFN